MPAGTAKTYDRSVFLNCAFDDAFRPIFRGIVFGVVDCGFDARCALEANDSGDVRIDKILKLIEACRYGIHDLSRTEVDGDPPLPRFNMPFELGLFLAAKRFGGCKQKLKATLIMEAERYRFQRTLSDIAGQDVVAHAGDVGRAIGCVRDWLAKTTGRPDTPGGAYVADRYAAFAGALPVMSEATRKTSNSLTFGDDVHLVEEWLRQTAP